MKSLSPGQWLQWAVATVIAGLTFVFIQMSYLHNTFARVSQVIEIKEQERRDVDLILKQLQSLDQKVDRLIERSPSR